MIKKIVTSYSPHRIERQQLCLASLLQFGIEVVGVQTEGEIATLAPHFPGVRFVSCERQNNPWNKPHLPRIAELLKQASEDPVLLINSDIYVGGPPDQAMREWSEADPDVLVIGIRYDHNKGSTNSSRNRHGIDAFRITPQHAKLLEHHLEFSIGVPGWDYWIPWRLWQAGVRIRAAKIPMYHERHDLGYPNEAVCIAYSLLTREYRMPPAVFKEFIQWSTGRSRRRRR